MSRKFFVFTIFLSLVFVSCISDDESECDFDNPCKEGFVCIDGKCVESIIEDNDEDDSDLPIETPDENETIFPDEFEWPDVEDGLCEPLDLLFCDPDDIYNVVRCNSMGDGIESVPCGDMTVCENARCVQQICVPGEPFCKEDDLSKVFKCNEYGSGTTMEVMEDCGQGGYCLLDKCIFYCDIAAQQRSYQGCDYFTAHLNTYTRRSDPIYALTISNLYTDRIVTVDITNFTETGEVDAGKNFFCIDDATACMSMTTSKGLLIHPGKLGIIKYPHKKMVKGTGKHWNSYRIKTDLPVTVYQFSPFDNSFNNPFETSGRSVDYSFLFPDAGRSYSNDASLLIPSASLGQHYISSSYRGVASAANSYVTIIGINEKDTVVTVKPSVNISAAGGIPAISSGNTEKITLKKGQVAQIEVAGQDISGTSVFCDPEDAGCFPFAVFAGADCVNIPFEYKYCDHIEQQMFPVSTWGQKYLLVKTHPRGEEWDYVRITASEDDTKLTFSPETPEEITVPSGWINFPVNPVKTELNAGEFSEFYFKGSLLVEADKPIMISHFLTASQMVSLECQNEVSRPDDVCVGDPAMMLIPPTEQFRKDYIFLTPGSYKENFATIVFKDGTGITLNDKSITDSTKIGDSGYSYTIVELGDKFARHDLVCDEPCGLYVYGWEADVSYAYPGGLDFEILSSN